MTTADLTALRTEATVAILASASFNDAEKAEIIDKLPKMEAAQLSTLLWILKEDAEKYAALQVRVAERMAELEARREEELRATFGPDDQPAT